MSPLVCVLLSSEPSARTYRVQRQLPEPSERKVAMSPAAVWMFCPVGRMRLVALCVRVNAPSNTTSRSMPAMTESKAVIATTPVMWT